MHPMKQALRMRRSRDIHTVMTPDEDRESMGLAPDAQHDLSHGMHGGEMANNADMAKHLLETAHMHSTEDEEDESKEDLAIDLLNQAHDTEGQTMPHSGQVQTSHDEASMGKSKKARSIKDASEMHEAHLKR